MKLFKCILLAMVATACLVQVQANVIDNIKETIGIGDGNESHKHKEHEEKLYQGGAMKQIAHTGADVALDRLAEYAKEEAPDYIPDPLISIGTSMLKKKVHVKINEYGEEVEDDGDKEEEEKKKEEKKKEEKKKEEKKKEEDGGHDHRLFHHGDDENGRGEEKEKKGHGLKGLLGLDRKKRSTETQAGQQAEQPAPKRLNRVLSSVKTAVMAPVKLATGAARLAVKGPMMMAREVAKVMEPKGEKKEEAERQQAPTATIEAGPVQVQVPVQVGERAQAQRPAAAEEPKKE